MFLNLVGNIVAFREANFVSEIVFPGVGNRETYEETSRIMNISATMFLSFLKDSAKYLPCSLIEYLHILRSV